MKTATHRLRPGPRPGPVRRVRRENPDRLPAVFHGTLPCTFTWSLSWMAQWLKLQPFSAISS